MKIFSLIICFISVIGLSIALSMDTTVATDTGTRVHNIGLVSDRQIYLLTSGIVLIAGAVLFGFSTLRPTTPIQKSGTRNAILVVTVLMISALGAWLSLDRKNFTLFGLSAKRETSNLPPSKYFIIEPPFVVNFEDEGRLYYLQVAIVLLLDESSGSDVIQTFSQSIRNDIILLLSRKSLAQLSSEEGKSKLAEEVRSTINQTVGGKVTVRRVFFTSYIIQ